jgi:hypothetical protein
MGEGGWLEVDHVVFFFLSLLSFSSRVQLSSELLLDTMIEGSVVTTDISISKLSLSSDGFYVELYFVELDGHGRRGNVLLMG